MLWKNLALVGLLALLAGCGSAPQAELGPPNIIVVMTDDQGWAQVGSHGNEVLKTPRLDELAGQAVEFTRFYVSPVCAPTRASLMTGRYNYRTGVVDTWMGRAMMHGDEVTIAEMLRDGGYRTGIFGKWHLGDNYPMRPTDQGFEEVLVHRGGGIGQPADPSGTSYFDPLLQHNDVQKKYDGYCTDIFFDNAIEWIQTGGEKPFFIYIPTNAPHSPYDVPDEYTTPYREAGLNDKDSRIYGMIANIDENMGKLMDALETGGIADNTILIFMTDNGPTTRHFTAGLRAQKANVYDGGIRVPFFLRWPAKMIPKKVERIAAHIDVPPTLLDAAGVAEPAGVEFDGVSLMGSLQGDTVNVPPRALYIQSHRGNVPERYRAFAAVTQKYKLVQPLSFRDPAPEDAAFELYDLEADPGEENDLAAEMPDMVEQLKAGYDEWFTDVSATRGYDPPLIPLGTEHENPVILTRQDWRVVETDDWGPKGLGYWQVDVQSTGPYDVTVRFDAPGAPAKIEFAMGDVAESASVAADATVTSFEGLSLPAGEHTLEARVLVDGTPIGVRYVDVSGFPAE